ncbi:MAG: FAD-binding protein [Alphaproteobacteria bacterium]|nr:FAD-binding protein [Alphaproteobacteria bacterium]
MSPLPHLLSPLTIRGTTFRNRIFSTGHMTMMVADGCPTDDLVAYHAARAAGGAGLIITEAARVHASGVGSSMALNATRDAIIPGYRSIAEAVHREGAKVFGQLSHSGRVMGLAADGTLPVAYSASTVPDERHHMMPRAIPPAMIGELVAGYASAAGRMREAGLDGVEILASHGLLPAQFLNPETNRRTDAYGGSADNRLRFLREIAGAVRARIGPNMVIGVRISGDELEHEGLTLGVVIDACMALDRDGVIDYVNVIAGSMAGLAGSVHVVPPMFIAAGYVAPLAGAVRSKVTFPVFVAGRINQPQVAERIIAESQADMCGMTRAMIADPQMPNKAAAGRLDDIRACIGCNQACIGHMQTGYPISCIQHPETGRERYYGVRGTAARRKTVMVVGGGPAGMKAAAVAAERGHDVTLYERGAQLGGQVLLAQLLPGRAEFGGLATNLAREVKAAGAKVSLRTTVDRAVVEGARPDAVIIATGAGSRRPHIEGAKDGHVIDAWSLLRGEANVGSRVVIGDWRCDWIGLGLAEKLARDGCKVRLAVNGTMAGQTIQMYVRDHWIGVLHKLGVEITPYVRVAGVEKEAVILQHVISGEAIVCEGVDTLVTSLGHEPDITLETELAGWGGEIHLIGDCLAPRTAEEAVLEGLKVGVAL